MIKKTLLDRLSERDIYTVTELNSRAKKLLEKHFSTVWVEGEISNHSNPSSGHWYFTLKDSGAQVRCAMFKKDNQSVKFKVAQGTRVVARARMSLYEARGDYQLIVEHMEPAGIGDLQQAFEALKKLLDEEGLFAPPLKKTVPINPAHIGIITSPTGAAIRDILAILKRRQPAMRITLYPVSVQGDKAGDEIAQAIAFANRIAERFQTPLQALIVGRGGGSLEDLWSFNQEQVARAIAASKLPVISAVGHEIDFTISDFVADLRAPTPSAAAELISTDQQEQRQQLISYRQWLGDMALQQLRQRQQQLAHLKKRLRHPGHQLQIYAQRLDDLEQRILRAITQRLQQQRNQLDVKRLELQQHNPQRQLNAHKERLRQLRSQLPKLISSNITSRRQLLDTQALLLNNLSPLAVLGRGYSISKQQGRVITDSQQLKLGDTVTTELAKGHFKSTIVEINAEKADKA
ncbi:exodeoxyribonuclease VII large subunit [Sinobacterium caligoides]|uniref:Exodeoxyribonuclease 7 large subunit n=1 Tax=Sinobacterium caligoides TaxID=933926 RepID=A0A3N2DZC6_9GAMM|nr:exodeoxyribonuclease VII large subunit [Sinobacterium caligoides]ROS05188.1 exodeoxyribonuclease VII large subunit [Sinobacterium caligoides]